MALNNHQGKRAEITKVVTAYFKKGQNKAGKVMWLADPNNMFFGSIKKARGRKLRKHCRDSSSSPSTTCTSG